MEKKVFFVLVIPVLVLIFSYIVGAQQDKIDKAFACLDSRVNETGELTLEQAVFAALTDSTNNKINLTINAKKHASENCWPSSGCTIKDSAQVLLAKNKIGQSTTGIENWLLSKKGTTNELVWFLQIIIDGNIPSTCEIRYDAEEPGFRINIDNEMEIRESGAGTCLTRTASGYWLQIGNNCLEREFDVSCTESFKTNLLYQRAASSTIYVSAETHQGDANGWTKEEITALCLKQGNACNYEGSLWAVAALYAAQTDSDNDGESDYLKFLPYLKALADSNEQYFPSSFLLHIVGRGRNDEYYDKIIRSFRADPRGGFWQVGQQGKYYDSALALLALGGKDARETEAARTFDYLFAIQTARGCWNSDSIRDTAFIIYGSGWMRTTGGGVAPLPVCGNGVIEAGEQCDGSALGSNSCSSLNQGTGNLGCYSAGHVFQCQFNVSGCAPVLPSCGNGIIEQGEECDGTNLSGKTCENLNLGNGNLGCYAQGAQYECKFNTTDCEFGSPEPPPIIGEDVCESVSGACKTQCGTNETEANALCFGNEICCIDRVTGGGGGGGITNCEAAGYFCAPDEFSCLEAYGVLLAPNSYSCINPWKACCTVQVSELPNCATQGGRICAADQQCSSSVVQASDGACCLANCETLQIDECTFDSDCGANEVCSNGQCVTSGIPPPPESKSRAWIWILILAILIILVVIGIIYRDKLRLWLFKKGRSKKGAPAGWPPPGGAPPMVRRMPPRFGPPGPPPMQQSMTPRQTFAPRPMMQKPPIQQRPAPTKPEPAKKEMSEKDKEMEETLKKLKEISK